MSAHRVDDENDEDDEDGGGSERTGTMLRTTKNANTLKIGGTWDEKERQRTRKGFFF